MDDLISRQAAIDALNKHSVMFGFHLPHEFHEVKEEIRGLPSVKPTLYGYDIEHLILIAHMLRKENLPPERVVEALTDIGQIVSIVQGEFELTLRKIAEQYERKD